MKTLAEAIDTQLTTAFGNTINRTSNQDNVVSGSIAYTSSELTIATSGADGVVTPTRRRHTIDTEADASSDDLDRADPTNLSTGSILHLTAENDGRTVVIRHSTGTGDGQFFLADDRDFTIDNNTGRHIAFELQSDNTWDEIWRANDRESGWRLISRVTASNTATADHITDVDSTHNHFMMRFSKVVPATDGQPGYIRISNDAGVSFEADAGDYMYVTEARNAAAASDTAESTSATQMIITEDALGVGSATSEGLSGELYFDSPDLTTAFHNFYWRTAYQDSGGNITIAAGAGMYQTAEAINGIQFLFASGNIESGEIELFGLTKDST